MELGQQLVGQLAVGDMGHQGELELSHMDQAQEQGAQLDRGLEHKPEVLSA